MKYLVERGGTMPLDIAFRIFLDILAGLHAAHDLEDENGRRLNLVHRDVSPQNMLVGNDGITKITDFGIARAESRLSTTRTGSVKGKVPYMSPEQVKSLPVDRRTDVYAAGVILWEMLTSKRLVQGETDVAMIYQVTDREASTPREWNPAIPELVANVCLKALEKRIENRFASAAEFMDALEEAARESTIVPATPRAVGNYIRGLGLHPAAAELEADFRRRSQLDLSGQSPESSSSTSMLNLISAPQRVLEGPKRPMVLMVVAATAVMVIGVFVWLGFSNTESASPTTNSRTTGTQAAAGMVPTQIPIAPTPAPTNPAPVVTNAPTDKAKVDPAPTTTTTASVAPTVASPATKTTAATTAATTVATAKAKPLGTTQKAIKRPYSPRGL